METDAELMESLKREIKQMGLTKMEISNLAFQRSAFYMKLAMLEKRAKNFSHLFYGREPFFVKRKVDHSF